MKKNLIELVFIIDKSGSMCGLEEDTIGGFNSMIEKQKVRNGDTHVSTVLFNETSYVLHNRVSINKVEPLNHNQYVTEGCTALLDSIGDAINYIKKVHKYAREDDKPEHTMFLITTDGMENASQKYSVDEIRKMINDQKEYANWEFIFVAANIDAIETASKIGISRDRAANYEHTTRGIRGFFRAADSCVDYMCSNSYDCACSAFDESWKDELEGENEE